MSFPRYPKYKASGVEWLGDVPDGWTVRPLKTIASGAGALFIDGDWIESKDISNAGIRYLTSGNVGEGLYKEQGQGFITDETFNELKCTEVLPGDLLISRLNLPIGRACIVPDLGSRIVTCVDNVVVRPASMFNRQFCVYLLSCKGHLENTEILGRGATMPRISRSALGRLPFAFPSLPEQTAIAEFLDRETGKIDELVAEQRRLMELLKEKRQAVISHAVTKGLNPHAPMKPSGIEWLGDVPEGWEVVPLKHLCVLLKDGTHLPPARVDDGIPLLSVRNLVSGKFVRRDDDSMISEQDYRELARAFVPKAEDVLLAIVGATIGKTAVIPSDLGLFHIQRSIAIFRTKPELLQSVFLNLVFQSRQFQKLLWELVGFSAQPGIYLGTLQNIRIPVPPVSEQLAIAIFLNAESAKFDTLTAEAQRTIDLLQERRTALISAAVTGQIDVRATHTKNLTD